MESETPVAAPKVKRIRVDTQFGSTLVEFEERKPGFWSVDIPDEQIICQPDTTADAIRQAIVNLSDALIEERISQAGSPSLQDYTQAIDWLCAHSSIRTHDVPLGLRSVILHALAHGGGATP